MFYRLVATTAAVLLVSTLVCEAAQPTAHVPVQAGASVDTLRASNGAPDAKEIMNTEESPLKGELWVYFGAESNREYLVRDGKIRWTGEVFHRSARIEETNVAEH